jgi:2-isopropylmalate synthase
MPRITIYDTTLRDGTQREGISLSADDKLRIAAKLDEFGVDYIEGGWPGSNPKDSEFFRKARDLKFVNAKLVAFGSTRRPNTTAPDATLQAIDEADTAVVALFGKSWRLHVTHVLKTTLEENLKMIGESVAFFKGRGREVVYDAEHFFDGYKDDAEYALATLRAATDAGADSLVLCDTNGGTMPSEIADITRRVVAEFGQTVGCIGIHAHNDTEVAVANSLVAVEAGATQVQGAMNGYGERAGNANLCSIIPNLALKMGHEMRAAANLARLTEVSRFVAEVANLALDSHMAYVGTSAFAHKAGMHVNAVLKT